MVKIIHNDDQQIHLTDALAKLTYLSLLFIYILGTDALDGCTAIARDICRGF